MATFTPDFNPGDTVWSIITDKGVLKGTVTLVMVDIITASTTATYYIQFVGDIASTAVVYNVSTPNIFNNVDNALAAYKLLIQ